MKYIDNTDLVEVGYRLLYKYWGNGYATEGAKALIDYGFNNCNLNEIVGITHPNNKRSQHVLEKCGLRFIKEWYVYETDVFYYSIKKT